MKDIMETMNSYGRKAILCDWNSKYDSQDLIPIFTGDECINPRECIVLIVGKKMFVKESYIVSEFQILFEECEKYFIIQGLTNSSLVYAVKLLV
jgi:hypothetical protein